MLRKRYDQPQRVHAWLAEARLTPPVDVFSTGDSYPASVDTCLQTAERAIRTGEVAPALISSWTGWAPSALARGERPEVPASSGTHGRLVDWYRQTFSLAVQYGLIDARWFTSREAWHTQAYRTFPGKLTDYYDHIYAAETALHWPERRKLVIPSDLSEWYRDVFKSAAQLGLAEPDDTENEVS